MAALSPPLERWEASNSSLSSGAKSLVAAVGVVFARSARGASGDSLDLSRLCQSFSSEYSVVVWILVVWQYRLAIAMYVQLMMVLHVFIRMQAAEMSCCPR